MNSAATRKIHDFPSTPPREPQCPATELITVPSSVLLHEEDQRKAGPLTGDVERSQEMSRLGLLSFSNLIDLSRSSVWNSVLCGSEILKMDPSPQRAGEDGDW